MADKIYLRAGNVGNIPLLADREPGFVRDEKALYIGTPEGNLKLCSAQTEGKLNDLTGKVNGLEQSMGEKLSASPAPAVADVAGDADTAAIAAKLNELIAAMKASGLMSI